MALIKIAILTTICMAEVCIKVFSKVYLHSCVVLISTNETSHTITISVGEAGILHMKSYISRSVGLVDGSATRAAILKLLDISFSLFEILLESEASEIWNPTQT